MFRKYLFRLFSIEQLWIFLSILIICTSIFLAFYNWAYDDPFISYRYAANLARGQGFVYNFGERSLSATSPFLVVLLAIFYPIWADVPHLANLIGAFSLALGGVFLWDLARSWKSPILGYTGLILYPTFPLMVSTLGSETPICLAFCLASFAFYARRNFYLSVLFVGMAILSRPDALILPIVFLADYLLRLRRPFPLKVVFLFIILVLPWFLFAYQYFGSPLPLTLAAKQQQGLLAISRKFVPGLSGLFFGYLRSEYFKLEVVIALAGIFFLLIHAKRWALFIAWPILYFISYSLLGVSSYFWYYAPLIPGFLILVGLGLSWILKLKQPLHNFLGLNPARFNRVAHILIILLISLLCLGQVKNLQLMRKQPDVRYQIYRAAGDWLRINTSINATVGTLETGIIGYYSNRTMVDFAGLLQPDVAENLSPAPDYSKSAEWAVEHYKPDYLVLFEGSFPDLQKDYVSKFCKSIHQFQGDQYGHPGVLDIYTCNWSSSNFS